MRRTFPVFAAALAVTSCGPSTSPLSGRFERPSGSLLPDPASASRFTCELDYDWEPQVQLSVPGEPVALSDGEQRILYARCEGEPGEPPCRAPEYEALRDQIGLVVREGDVLRSYLGANEVIAALSPIDTPDEAGVVVALQQNTDLILPCVFQEPPTGAYEVEDGYEVVFHGDITCEPDPGSEAQIETVQLYSFHVAPDGSISSDVHESWQRFCGDSCECWFL